jgi:hypothetical protein
MVTEDQLRRIEEAIAPLAAAVEQATNLAEPVLQA